MNSKRRAELQRRLSMGAVPRPPADLAERIKADIPKYLDANPAPRRFVWGATMRIAATLITLLTTALVTLQVMQPANKGAVQSNAQRETFTPAVLRYGPPQPVSATAAAPRAESEVSLDITQEVPPAARMLAEPQERRMEAVVAEDEIAATAEAPPVQVADASVRPEADAPPPPPPMVTVPAAAPAPAPAPAPALVGRAVGVAANESRERITVYSHAPLVAPAQQTTALAPQSQAREKKTEQADIFGISLDPAAFPAIRTAIENGTRPSPAAVNVEALVNYFAGAQSSRHEVGLEVEASPAPIAMEGDVALLRFSVDTANIPVPEDGFVPAVARDAHLHIDIDPQAVASFRRIGDSGSEESEEALRYNTSVTGLYELKLKPNLRSTQRIATVRLQYVSAKNGRKQSVTRIIHGADLARTWDRASRRHRLAALGAIWSETLKGTVGGVEIAKRAEELATQNPQDTRARELATAATMSTGGER